MSGMNPGFQAYLDKKKAAASGAAPVTTPVSASPTAKRKVVLRKKSPIPANMKTNAAHAAIQQRAAAY